MVGPKNQPSNPASAEAKADDGTLRLKDALRIARVEAAERSGVVIDLHDAEIARLELLNEALDPLFAEIPSDIELFDRGISRGQTPRLWIDAIAHVSMGRDKRVYRFLQDTSLGRRVVAESVHVPEIVEAVTNYVAHRLIERERALAGNGLSALARPRLEAPPRRRSGWRAFWIFLLGILVGVGTLVALALLLPPRGL